MICYYSDWAVANPTCPFGEAGHNGIGLFFPRGPVGLGWCEFSAKEADRNPFLVPFLLQYSSNGSVRGITSDLERLVRLYLKKESPERGSFFK